METDIDTVINSLPVTASALPLPLPGNQADQAKIKELSGQLEHMAALADLIGRIESTGDLQAACQVAVNQIQGYLGVDRVVIGLCEKTSPRCHLSAISGVANPDRRSEQIQLTEAVLQESVAKGTMAQWPATDPQQSAGLAVHRQFVKDCHVEAAISSPLFDADGQLRGAWLVTGSTEAVHSERTISFLRIAATSTASALDLVSRVQRNRIQQALENAGNMIRNRRSQAMMMVAVALMAVLCMPVRYYPQCDCVTEPARRCFVAAPFSGPLEKSVVEPGDVVQKGQLLARMDGREIRWELAGKQADLHRASKEYAAHLAAHDLGESEAARHEVERLQVEADLLQHRDDNIEIRSPIAGMVVSGDHEDAEGMPLDIGQTLFEVAPLNEMIMEVAIAEEDYSYIRPGMPVTIRLDAFPLKHFDATIDRIQPRSELREEKNVFVADVRLALPAGGLRPGMRGSAKIEADRYPIGWILLRYPITTVAAWLGW